MKTTVILNGAKRNEESPHNNNPHNTQSEILHFVQDDNKNE